jgi:hypothetical protein
MAYESGRLRCLGAFKVMLWRVYPDHYFSYAAFPGMTI